MDDAERRSRRPGPRHGRLHLPEGLRGWRARYELGAVCRLEGDLAGAESHWRQALASKPDYLLAGKPLAELLLAQQRWAELEEFANRLERMTGGEPDAELFRCRALLGQGLLEQARVKAEALVQRWPEWYPGKMELSDALRQLGDLAGAEKVLREILQRDPHHSGAQHNLAVLRGQLEGKKSNK